MAKTVWVDFDVMERFMESAFIKVGVPAADAGICAKILITADKRGIDSHGVGRFKPIYIDRILAGIQNPVTEFEILREGPTTAVIDGHDGMGHVIGHRAMEMAIHKARQFGMGMVAVQFHPLRYCRVLWDDGCRERYDWIYRHQCQALHCANLRRGKYAGYQSFNNRLSYG